MNIISRISKLFIIPNKEHLRFDITFTLKVHNQPSKPKNKKGKLNLESYAKNARKEKEAYA